MFVPFDQLPENARLWVYQANTTFNPAQEEELSKCLLDFCESWEVHGQPLRTSFTVQLHRFVILTVDVNHNEASGCSIDGSVRILKSFGQQNRIDFFDRTQVAFIENSVVRTFALTALKDLFAREALGPNTLLIDTLVTTRADFAQGWIKRVADSWLIKYLPKKVVADS